MQQKMLIIAEFLVEETGNIILHDGHGAGRGHVLKIRRVDFCLHKLNLAPDE